jgi:hypothetical protein
MINSAAIMNALETHALQLGHFSNVNGHEPKSPPQVRDQINLSFWAGVIQPVQSSGLQSLSYRWEIVGRVYMSADSEPADAIDPALVDVTFALLTSLAGDFTLDSSIGGSQRTRCVDFLGMDGKPLEATPGYFDYDGATLRTMDIIIPLIINDVTDLGA